MKEAAKGYQKYELIKGYYLKGKGSNSSSTVSYCFLTITANIGLEIVMFVQWV